MPQYVSALLAALSLIGCASAPLEQAQWAQDGVAEGQFETERYECMKEADALSESYWCAGIMCFISSSPFPKYFSACMEARGWRRNR